MDGETPAPSFATLAERLLALRLSRPDLLETAANRPALAQAFHRLASIFALDQAGAAGEPPRAIISTLVTGLAEATQAGACRVMLRQASGGQRLLEAADDLLAPPDDDAHPAAIVSVALARLDGEVVGALELGGGAAAPFDDEALAVAAEVGRHIA